MTLILPPPLPPRATLGVIAPSSPIEPDEAPFADRGYARLRAKGLEVVEAANCRHIHHHAAGSPRQRADALHTFFLDPDIHAIMAFWGGLHTHQMLEFVDWDLIKAHPKPLIGYSDMTCLLNAVTHRAGLVTFLGPAVITFAKPTLFEYSWDCFAQMLLGPCTLPHAFLPAPTYSDNAWYSHPDKRMIQTPSAGWRTWREGQAQGRSVGGNLGVLLLLAGTPYWPDLQDAILILEDDESETPQTLWRMFTQARHMGLFSQIKGLVIGRFPQAVGLGPQDPLEAILDWALADFEGPVLLDLDCGHTDPLMTLPLGVECRLDATAKTFAVLEPWLAS